MAMLGNVRPLTGHIGAEIGGIDLKTLDDAAVAAIRAAWLEHKVVFFPRQELTADELVGVARRFGEIEPPHAGLRRHPDNDDVLLLETHRKAGDGRYNDIWHSDVTFAERPPMASMLHAVKLPAVGGDTLFSSMTAAWDALSEPLKRAVEGLEAYHDGIPNFTAYLSDPGQPNGRERLARMRQTEPGAVHPVVRRHPETGRRALFVNRAFTTRILGLSEIESRGLLDLLIEHCEQSSFQMRWRWTEGDVALWDNRHALHNAAFDYGDEHRVMHRVTLKGDRPVA
jgi:taurine dioxygenase